MNTGIYHSQPDIMIKEALGGGESELKANYNICLLLKCIS